MCPLPRELYREFAWVATVTIVNTQWRALGSIISVVLVSGASDTRPDVTAVQLTYDWSVLYHAPEPPSVVILCQRPQMTMRMFAMCNVSQPQTICLFDHHNYLS